MQTPEQYLLEDDGQFPNSRYPVLAYRGVLAAPSASAASDFERLFSKHAWPAAWRNGIYDYHHYHSTAHEALGVYQGWVHARLGGARGQVLTLRAGDVVVIPAGVAHCNEGQSEDFRVVGAYPAQSDMDMNYGKPGERPEVDRSILALPLPEADPVYGAKGPLLEFWSRPASGRARST
jgi:uncharacterized protein YjlB